MSAFYYVAAGWIIFITLFNIYRVHSDTIEERIALVITTCLNLGLFALLLYAGLHL